MAYYVYRVTHNQEQKHYIGSRGCEIAPVEDLGQGYFTSSAVVAPLFRAHPEQFKTKILRCFETRVEALAFERKCHLRLGVVGHPRFYNQVIAGEKFVASGPHSEEHKRKIGAANTGKKRPDLTAQNKLGLLKGVPKSEEHKRKLREAAAKRRSNLGKPPLVKRNKPGSTKGRPKSEEHKRKLREAAAKRWARPEERQRASERQTGTEKPWSAFRSDETKQKQRAARIEYLQQHPDILKGENNPMFGKPRLDVVERNKEGMGRRLHINDAGEKKRFQPGTAPDGWTQCVPLTQKERDMKYRAKKLLASQKEGNATEPIGGI